ncbi:SPOR domain-containing protein [Thalassospira sp. MCCC 1A01428]|uniref:SPOR domain-containing protein n=1 Tax=Thalassospira sp. MCCC 1A01428 TaxID=1470575 RepID=UPI000A1FE7C6|nr:SPOR domain-containing protein [Thalassospira sp. MCCC 1A01428]OSQ35120.1 hypothetical protein THS27_24660 [Thalassospira sp. MCCC 1A01428]
MDRKTLLGLITGACMLGLVLFFGGMLVGAGLFMGPDAPQTSDVASGDKMELLAQNTAPRIQTDITQKNPQQTGPMSPVDGGSTDNAPETTSDMPSTDAAGSNEPQGVDPVGDLIAEKAAGDSDADQNNPDDNGAPAVPDMGDSASSNATTPDASAMGADEGEGAANSAGTSDSAVSSDDQPAARPVAPDIRKDAKPPKPAPQKETAVKAPKTAETETAASAALHREPGSKNMPYSIQVGAFKVDANARQRAGELRKKGLEVAVVERGSNDGAWYYVRVGAYPNATTARTGAEKVKKDTGIDGFPVRAEPNDKTID